MLYALTIIGPNLPAFPFHKAEVSGPDRPIDFGEQRNTHMSPHAVNNFVSDLVLMAQAMERLPQVEAELAEWQRMAAARTDEIVRLQADIDQGKAYASSLEQKVHDLEVAKDAAETMFLEADDRTARALDFVKTMFGSAGSLIQALEPVKPQPEPAAGTSIHDTSSGHVLVSAPTPIPADSPALVGGEGAKPWHGDLEADAKDYHEAQGQSAADPTTTTLHQEPSYPNAGGGTTGVALEPQTEASTSSWASPTPPDTKPQPYAGKNYYEWPVYVSLADWLEGGGTDKDYWHRREA
jgi:hypothetical protein